MNEHDYEPIRGLPARLPPGEELLWQGEPRWPALARRAFHTRKIAIYCGILLVWRVVADLSDGASVAEATMAGVWIMPLATLAIGIPALLARLFSRSTVYTITSRRVVIRFGVALPMTVNIPFRAIGSAGLKIHKDGTGDIPLALAGPDRIAYLHLWPNVRPWRFARAEPMLRAIPEPERVAEILAGALSNEAAERERAARGDPARAASADDARPLAA